MATVTPTTDRNSINGAIILTYALTTADTGTAMALPIAADLTAQVSGTFGAATVLMLSVVAALGVGQRTSRS